MYSILREKLTKRNAKFPQNWIMHDLSLVVNYRSDKIELINIPALLI